MIFINKKQLYKTFHEFSGRFRTWISVSKHFTCPIYWVVCLTKRMLFVSVMPHCITLCVKRILLSNTNCMVNQILFSMPSFSYICFCPERGWALKIEPRRWHTYKHTYIHIQTNAKIFNVVFLDPRVYPFRHWGVQLLKIQRLKQLFSHTLKRIVYFLLVCCCSSFSVCAAPFVVQQTR